MDFDFDLFVIGGGSGGVRAARVAAAEGKTVGLAEESRMGGTCVIRGCVPKKLMVFASSFGTAADDAGQYGWDITKGDFDWPSFQSRLHGELDRLEGVYQSLLKNSGVEMFHSRAVLVDKHTVKLGNGVTKTARHILIATGGRPVRPQDVPNAHLGLVSDDIFNLKALPKRMLIIGGGYIACEFACILNGLGVEVEMYLRGAQILNGFDDEARGLVAETMKQSGIVIHTGTNILDMCPAADKDNREAASGTNESMGVAPAHGSGPLWVKTTMGAEAEFDAVFFATGRAPNTNDLGLEDIGVDTGRKGEIVVDDFSKTSVDHIYAIGDVTGRVELTPVAIREGMAFVETVFKDNPTPVDHDLIPTAVFTQPEVGTVGLTEEQAAAQEPIDVYCTSFRPMQGAFIEKADRVLMKLLVSQKTRKVLGCHIVADGAGEMIQMAGIAVKMGATKEDFDRVCAVHPTMSEELVTMKTPVRSA